MSDTPTDQQSPAPGGAAATPQSAPAGTAQPGSTAKNTDDIESLLDETEAAMSQAQLDETLASSALPTGQPPSEAKSAEASDSPQPYQFGDLQGLSSDEPPHSLDLLGDVELDLRIELGRTLMRLEDVLRLRGGSVVALDKLAGDPVDIYINGRLIARGEVLVMNDNFCIRVTELVGSGSKNV